MAESLRLANVPPRHIAKESNSLHGEKWHAALEGISRRHGDGFLIALVGTRGTGKTQLAVMLIRQACAALRPARYVKAMDLFRDLRACFRDEGPSEIDTVARYTRPQLLVIDEAHERGQTPFEARTLNNIIDHRYDHARDTLLISNESASVFFENIGPSIASRIKECGTVIECGWESYR